MKKYIKNKKNIVIFSLITLIFLLLITNIIPINNIYAQINQIDNVENNEVNTVKGILSGAIRSRNGCSNGTYSSSCNRF